LAATKDPLALRYNGVSILENMHVSEGIQLLLNPTLNFLDVLTADQFKEFYGTVVQLVLATDMARHIEITSQFAALVNSGELSPTNKNHRLMLLKIMVKFSDISNPSRPWQTCVAWSRRVMDEFFAQGDREKKLSLPISPFMDRETTNLAKCQAAFTEFVVIPSAELICKAIPALDPIILQSAKANLVSWKAELQQHPPPPSAPH
jgi:hypothetical protein